MTLVRLQTGGGSLPPAAAGLSRAVSLVQSVFGPPREIELTTPEGRWMWARWAWCPDCRGHSGECSRMNDCHGRQQRAVWGMCRFAWALLWRGPRYYLDPVNQHTGNMVHTDTAEEAAVKYKAWIEKPRTVTDVEPSWGERRSARSRRRRNERNG